MVETINKLAELGFGMTMRDIGELVYSYVQATDHERTQKIMVSTVDTQALIGQSAH